MNRKAQKTVERHEMLRQGETVIAAVSGGADSVALLHFLCFNPIPDLRVRACHLNHNLRGEESLRDQRLVERMCREYGVELDVEQADAAGRAKVQGVSVELAARNLRYDFFERLSERYGGKVATAHTLSDGVETILLNMIRGTGLEGLCGIPYRRGNIVRPLLDCSRSEVEDYCRGHDLAYHIDSTNQDKTYRRNYIRHEVVPGLLGADPGALGNVKAMMERLRGDRDVLTQLTQEAWADCEVPAGLSVDRLRDLHPALRQRVLMRWLREIGVEVNSRRVEKLEEMLIKPEFHTISFGETIQGRIREGVLYSAVITPKPRRRGLSGNRVERLGNGQEKKTGKCG